MLGSWPSTLPVLLLRKQNYNREILPCINALLKIMTLTSPKGSCVMLTVSTQLPVDTWWMRENACNICEQKMRFHWVWNARRKQEKLYTRPEKARPAVIYTKKNTMPYLHSFSRALCCPQHLLPFLDSSPHQHKQYIPNKTQYIEAQRKNY